MRSVLLTFSFVCLLSTIGFSQTLFGEEQVISNRWQDVRGASSVDVADIDGDGDMDVLATSFAYDKVGWYKNDGNQRFVYHLIGSSLNENNVAKLADLDGDGDLDVLTVVGWHGRVVWFENRDGRGDFGGRRTLSSTESSIEDVHAVDLDNDGDLDILSAHVGQGELYKIENLGNGNFDNDVLINDSVDFIWEVSSGDFNGDGYEDILVSHPGNGRLVWFKNDETGNFADLLEIDDIDTWSSQPVDIDGDGDLDVLSGGDIYDDGVLSWYENNNSVFGPANVIDQRSGRIQKAIAADLDNDGDMDVIAAVRAVEGEFIYFINNGFGNFSPGISLTAEVLNGWDLRAADMDRDGDLDILSASYSNSRVSWYENLLGEPIMLARGRAYWDKDEDGEYNEDDIPFAGLGVTVQPEGEIFYTNTEGEFNAIARDPISNSIEFNSPIHFECDGPVDFTLAQPTEHPRSFDFAEMTIFNQDFSYTGSEGNCKLIEGIVFQDEDEDGLQGESEDGLGGILVTTDVGVTTYSKPDGSYELEVVKSDEVEIGLELTNTTSNGYCGNAGFTNYTQTAPEGDAYISPADSGSVDTLDFGVYVEQSNEYDVGLYSLVVQHGNDAGQEFHGWMDFKAAGTILNPCTLRIEHSPLVTLLSSDIWPTNQGDTFKEWVFNAGAIPSMYCMQMDWYLDSTAVEGQILHWEGSYECPPGEDGCPDNNSIEFDVEVYSGPAVRVDERPVNLYSTYSKGIRPEVIGKETVLSYLITFQNPTTSTIYDLTIIDTLPDELDWSTISFPFSSFPQYDLTISDDGIMKWEMNYIYLSEVDRYPINSFGFVQFNITMRSDLPDGAVIPNTAHAIFNGNPPLASNEFIHRLDQTVAVIDPATNSIQASIFPNPFSINTTFQLTEALDVAYDLALFDVEGKELRNYRQLTATSLVIEQENFPSGLYFLNVRESISGELLGTFGVVVE